MTDISRTITPKSDQLNADDFLSASQKTMTIRVTGVDVVAGDQPVVIHYENEAGKPYKPGKSMRRVLAAVWGSESSQWVGKQMTLYREPSIRFGGDIVGGIRISHMSGIERDITIPLTETRGKRKPHTVKPLHIEEAPKPKAEPSPDQKAAAAKKKADDIVAQIAKAQSVAEIEKVFESNADTWARIREAYPDHADRIEAARDFAVENLNQPTE